MSDESHQQTRLRITFGKRGTLRYTSHLDLARIWERLLRRARANVVYSQGFNPRPKIQLAAALPLGYTSSCEILDVWLDDSQPPDLNTFEATLQASVPEGLDVLRVEVVDLRGPALQMLVREADYHITLPGEADAAGLKQAVDTLLAAAEILRERRGKPYDLRPLVHGLQVEANGEGLRLAATLSLGETATGRPDELLDALGLDPNVARVERVALRFDEEQPSD